MPMSSASAGVILITISFSFPVSTVMSSISIFSAGFVTVTVHFAVFPSAEAVITAVPEATAVTLPFLSTVATAVALDVHVTVLSSASSGLTAAVRVADSPFLRESSFLSRVTLVTGTVTVTSQLALAFPAVALIVTVPLATAVTLPFSSTVAISSLLLLQTILSVLFVGSTVAVRVSDLPFSRVRVVLLRVTPVAGTVTVTSHSADTSPAVAVITALPPPTAVTLPFSSTVATSSLSLLHTTLSVLSVGATVAVRVSDLPFSRARVVLLRVTPVAGTVSVTVTSQLALASPAVAVMVAVPLATAITLPFSSTVATASSLLLHTTSSVLFSGSIVASRENASPFSRVISSSLRVIPVACILGVSLSTVLSAILSIPPTLPLIIT